jgi:pimeloyl-ACP methyl ester carboxylesterase
LREDIQLKFDQKIYGPKAHQSTLTHLKQNLMGSLQCLFAFLVTAILSLSSTSVVAAKDCDQYLSARKNFSGFVRTTTGRDLYLKVEHPTQSQNIKQPVFLLHGLLDASTRFDELAAKLLKKGHPVIRADIYGFGKSLIQELKRNQGSHDFLKSLPFELNVTDVKDLIIWSQKKFNFGPLKVVGHSMGGGILGVLASDPQAHELFSHLTMITPYIYRLDRYHLEKIYGPWAKYYLPLLDPAMDVLMMNAAMEKRFKEHLDDLSHETPISESLKEALVTSAIATVKGLRDLNLLRFTRSYSSDLHVDVVISLNDELIPVQMQNLLTEALPKARVLKLNTTHMAPSEAPDELAIFVSGD